MQSTNSCACERNHALAHARAYICQAPACPCEHLSVQAHVRAPAHVHTCVARSPAQQGRMHAHVRADEHGWQRARRAYCAWGLCVRPGWLRRPRCARAVADTLAHPYHICTGTAAATSAPGLARAVTDTLKSSVVGSGVQFGITNRPPHALAKARRVCDGRFAFPLPAGLE